MENPMLSRQLLFCALTCLSSASVLHAQSVNLTEAPLEQRSVRNELTMTLEGTVTVKQNDKDVAFPHRASAKHVFLERFLEVKDGVADKAARFYTTAESAIRFNNNAADQRSLREPRAFMVAQRTKDKIVSYSPKGALTRAEVELTEHFDTMAVAGLLPGKMIEVGKTWTIPNRVALALCDLEGLLQHDLEAKLESVEGGIAHVKIVGKAQGVDQGAEVSLLINAHFDFDVKQQRIVALEWKQTDDRKQGPIGPAVSADMTIKLTRTPIETPEQLSDNALVPIPGGAVPPSELTNVVHQDAKKRFTLSYPRDWHVVSDSTQLVMRLIDRGDLISQATVSPWKKVDPASVMKLDEFAELMAKTPSWQEDKEIERRVVNMKGLHTVYRVASSGLLSTGSAEGVRTVQYFYLMVSNRGEQLIVTFSMTPQQVQRFGDRDLELVRDLVFPDGGGNDAPGK
jgi:hypothetical protein